MTVALTLAAATLIVVATAMACNGHRQMSPPILALGVACLVLGGVWELSHPS